MSRWTHVAGSVRLDDLSFLLEERNTAKAVEKILGPMCLFEKWNEKSKIPRGSEGGIEYQIYTNKHDSSIARFSINFLGDLRDFDETDTVEIDKWFRKLLEEDIPSAKNMIGVRDAILKVEVEYGISYVLFWREGRVYRQCLGGEDDD